MSSNLCIDLPVQIRRENSCQIIDDIRGEEISSVLFDWTNCTDADKTSLCLLLNLVHECEEKGIKVRHASHEKNTYYTAEIKPFFASVSENSESQEVYSAAFIAVINDESAIASQASALVNYLKDSAGLKNRNLIQAETIFSELCRNILQHSCTGNGIGLAAVDSENHKLDLIVSDIGVGIPSNIKEMFEEYEEKKDSEAILLATEDLSAKSTEENYGKGLNTVCNTLYSLDGTIHIFSGNGIVDLKKGKQNVTESKDYQPGTLIHVVIDFRNFDKSE